MIHVIAQISIQPGRREDFLAEFRQIVPLVLAEDGCLEYSPAVDAETPIAAQHTDEHLVVIIEKWESVAHLEAHLAAEHMQAYRERVKEMVTDTRLQILSPA
jgi:quinol monooxygenase YgiN